ncbi:chemotaxis-specific protein-glutamate methyltransferase CheB [Magnetofaba australis]|uniref:Protein-glutamate methylesterase/protein-glutamine glutaminase n=1 Tax=Magnetofaba australis IT-1 TaxID=1434232 RepID=A0A1Y2K680_9PROT|nr:chemotaxis-specific protein-glutamate methyltransferase CheB [Magnetofaba australis]OSM05139.1 putative response regulator receiver modulated CheB methylesterase [Magnetofaba australis IT-1]
MIRVVLVDDSPIALAVLQKILAPSPDIEVVGTARHGVEALRIIPKLKPDVVCTDLHMPHMDGLELTRQIMRNFPLPILVVSISVQNSGDDSNIFQLIEAGAIDVFPKPRGGLEGSQGASLAYSLSQKIRVLSGVVPIRRHAPQGAYCPVPGDYEAPRLATRPETQRKKRLVAIGASTGGPQALMTIFSNLPADFSAPILCVQHMSEGFLMEMIKWLQQHTALRLSIAQEGESPRAGHIYFPQEKRHMVINAMGRMSMKAGHERESHVPSVDELFHSVAEFYGPTSVGVLLTGMGRDGADGMKSLHDQQALTIAQDQASCVVYGMPQKAVELGAVQYSLSVDNIASELIRCVTTPS